MAEPAGPDTEYQERVLKAVLEAIMRASLVADERGGEPTAFVKNYEVEDVLLTLIAGFVSGAEVLSTPQKVRQHADRVAKRLAAKIRAVQAAGSPFPTITVPPTTN